MAAISPDIIRNPYIGTNNNWYVWDSTAYTFIDSGVNATGSGVGVASIVKTSTVGLVDTYTITYTDLSTSTFDVTNGAQGDKGDTGDTGETGATGAAGADGVSAYVHIKWAAEEPTSDGDMSDTPSPWIGIYSGTSATAPTTYTSYTWYQYKGDKCTIYYGTAITGTSTTPTSYVTGITLASAGDIYIYNGTTDSEIGNEYICTYGGNDSTALWIYLRNVRGPAGAGSGDMLAATYDPTSVGGDAFDMDNMAQGATNKYVSATELTVLQATSGTNTGDQSASDFNHDDLSNISGTAGQYNHPTDAQMTVLGNTSGTNTGDQTLPTRDSLGLDTDDTVTFANLSGTNTGDETPYASTPEMDGTGSAGTSDAYARGDHVHPSDTSRIAASTKGVASGVASLDANTKVTASQTSAKTDYKTASYTLVLGDAGKVIDITTAAASTLTVPTHASVAFPTDTEIEIRQSGAGTVTITPASGVTIHNADSAYDIAAKYRTVTLKRGSGDDEWYLDGDLA